MSRGTSDRVVTSDILERMTDAFIALDDDWRLIYVNDRARTVLDELLDGVEPDDLIGERLLEHLRTACGQRFMEQCETVMADREQTTLEEHYPPADAWFEVRVYPSEPGLSMYFRDITDRKKRTSQQERDQAALATLYRIASDPDATFEKKLDRVLDLGCDYFDLAHGFLTDIEGEGNNAIQRIVASQSDHELLQPGQSCPLSEAYCQKTIQTDGMLAVVDAVDEGWKNDPAYEAFGLGSYIGSKVLVDGELYGTLCFADADPRDESFRPTQETVIELLAQWVGYEREREESRQELLDTNQRLERVTSVLSHDLRNPLHVAKAHLDAASGECDSEHLDTVAASHERMETLLSELLTLAQQGRTVDTRRRVGLEAIATAAWKTSETADASLTLVDDFAFGADAERIQQALENLFANAIHHGDEEVTVEVGTLDSGGFYIADDGPGIPEEAREDVFASGYTTADEGTGLGLATVRRIVEAHGWSIEVTESAAGGARFEVTGVTPLG